MPDQLLRSAYIAAEGPLVLNGETLIGIIVKDTYVFSTAHENASEVTAYEVEPVSTESRLTGTCAVVLNDAETAWLPLVTGTTAVDLSDVEDRGGIVWVRPGASDAVRKIIGWAADIGPADAAYLPTWPDGLYAELIAPISGSDPLALGDLSDTDTDGVNAGDSLVFDGATWVPGNAGTPDLLNPASHAGPGTSAGVDGLIDVGSAGVDYEAVPGAAVPIPANAWTGNKVFNQFASTVGSAGYPSAGFEYHAVGVYAALRLRDPAAEWTEISTVHAYSDGDTDETHDYAEIAIVQLPGGVCLGWNGRVNDSLPEYKFVTDPVDVPLFDREFDLDVTLDPATGEIEFFVDGVSKGGGVIEEDGTDDPPSLPLTMTIPASTCDLMTASVAVTSIEMTEFGDSTVLIGIDVADSAGVGDQSFVSHGRTWTGAGRVTGPFTRPALTIGPFTRPSWPITGSQTWVMSGLDVYDGVDAYGGSLWWEANLASVLSGGIGWGFGHVTGAVEYGFAISDGTTDLIADAGALPTEPGMIAAVLDRGTDELRLYTWNETDGLTLADTVDASALGTVDPPTDVSLLTQANALLTGGATAYDRVLTPFELEYLARNIPPLPDTAGAGGGTTDASELTTGTLPFARLPIGTTSTTVPAGNDTRLSDARTPTAHKTSHATGGGDALAPSDIGAVPTSRTLAGLDLTADLTASTLRIALGLVLGTDVVPMSYLDTDGKLAADSDSKLATQKATKSYVDVRFPIHRSATSSRRISTRGSFSPGAADGMTTTGDRVYAPIFLPAGTYNTLSIRTTTAGTSTWRLGIFNGATGDPTRPGTVLVDAGTVDTSVTAAMLTKSSLAFVVAADGWYWCCAQVETYTSAPALAVNHAANNADTSSFPGWPGQEANYLRPYTGYWDLSPSAGALTTANAITGNSSTGLDYAANVPRFWVGP